MQTIREFITSALEGGAYRLILSGAAKGAEYRRVTLMRDGEGFFIEKLTEKQAFHERIPLCEAADAIERLFFGFSQINAWSESHEFTARITKKGKLLSGKHPARNAPENAGVERKKRRLLPEGEPIPPLVDMGVMNADGSVVPRMSDKLRQINRFLEFIDELIDERELENNAPLHIVDFGCGKSYLTFIVYYYFTEIAKKPVVMTGLDLKRDVIEFCTALSQKYGYKSLKFHCGDIADFAESHGGRLDLMLSLHACDTATDLALFNAVRFGARYILSSPCCQHELNASAKLSALPLLDDGGILRERSLALLTDSIRQRLLTACSYSARVMEFVELSHTPKNLMIRAKKAPIPLENRRRALEDVRSALALFETEQTLHRLLTEAGLLPKLHD